MAIIPTIPGVEVTIHINDRAAVEYADPKALKREQENKNAVCTNFIECEDNSPFGIHLEVTDEYNWGYKGHSLQFVITIDGTTTSKKWTCPGSDTNSRGWKRIIDYLFCHDDNGQLVEQGFKFTSIIKVDNANEDKYIHDLHRVAAGLGTIEVKVYRVVKLQSPPGYVPPVEFTLAKEALKGKAISHGTGYSTPKAIDVDDRYVQLPDDNGPIAIFQFLYRSKEALVQEGVTPFPGPRYLPEQKIKREETESTTSAPLAGLTQEKIESLAIERLQQLEPDHTTIAHKRKRDEEEDVKREHKYKTSIMANGKELVELDKDD